MHTQLCLRRWEFQELDYLELDLLVTVRPETVDLIVQDYLEHSIRPVFRARTRRLEVGTKIVQDHCGH